MLPEIDKVKGVHPGIILQRELKTRGIKNKELAALIGEYPQTISAIIKAKRSITPKLSILLGKKLETEPEYFMVLQANYDVKQTQLNSQAQEQDKLKVRKILFWDTDYNKIDWIKNKDAVIKRVFERGNDHEIEETTRYYGTETVKKALESMPSSYLHTFQYNKKKYLANHENL